MHISHKIKCLWYYQNFYHLSRSSSPFLRSNPGRDNLVPAHVIRRRSIMDVRVRSRTICRLIAPSSSTEKQTEAEVWLTKEEESVCSHTCVSVLAILVCWCNLHAELLFLFYPHTPLPSTQVLQNCSSNRIWGSSYISFITSSIVPLLLSCIEMYMYISCTCLIGWLAVGGFWGFSNIFSHFETWKQEVTDLWKCSDKTGNRTLHLLLRKSRA